MTPNDPRPENAPAPTPLSPFDILPSPVTPKKPSRSPLVGVSLVILLLVLIGNSMRQRDTGRDAMEAERVDKIEKALRETKELYGERAENGQHSRNVLPTASKKPGESYTKQAERVEESWHKIADTAGAHPSDWRRLGLVQAVFNVGDALKSFRHIPAVPLPDDTDAKPVVQTDGVTHKGDLVKPAKTEKTKTAKKARKKRTLPGDDVPPAQEVALWEAIYGPKPLPAAQVPALRATLKKLDMGWFEGVAAADLYTKAGQYKEAHQAEAQAKSSIGYLTFFSGLEGLLLLGGFFVMFWYYGPYLNPRRPVLRSPNYPQAVAPPYGQPIPPPPIVPPVLPPYGYAPPLPAQVGYVVPALPTAAYKPETPRPYNPFSYHARMVAFVAYLGFPLLLTLPFGLLQGMAESWTAEQAIRFSTILEMVIEGGLLVFALALLRGMYRRERQNEPSEDYPAAGVLPMGLREVWATLGMRSSRIGQDVLTGLLGYTTTLPLLTISSLISYGLFSRFHTPPHPVLLEVTAMHTPLDRLLLLLETAVLVPIIEETMFRGMLYPALRERWGVWGGIALSSAIFALLHPTLPGGFLPLWTLGACFAYTYEKRGSLLPGIIMHALNNGLLLLMTFAELSS